jgi:subtilisin family serine protease
MTACIVVRRRARGKSAAGLIAPVLVVAAFLPLRPVAADATRGHDARTSVIVTLDPEATRFGTAVELAALGRQVTGALDPDAVGNVAQFSTVPAMVVDVAAGAVDDLAAQPGVLDVSPNRQLRPLVDNAAEQIGAGSAWSAGLTGAGTTIAVVDTGVDAAHPMLAGKVVREGCFTPSRTGGGGFCPNGQIEQIGTGAAAPCVGTLECGHGTHVAGTAAGFGDGNRGIASDASIIAVQVFASAANPADGVGTDEASVIRALEWIYTLRDTYRVAAINLSLGGEPVATPCSGSAALLTVLERLDMAGVAVVAAAGNDGATTRVSFPACLPGVVSVGSLNRSGIVSPFSNSAASLTLLAPGQDIEGPWISPLAYRTTDGTSFAAPHVSGAIAVLRAALAEWPVSSIVSLLDRTGDVARRSPAGEFLRANAIRLDRAIQPQYHARTPASVVPAAAPIGWVDAVSSVPGGLRVSGWALDGDTVVPTTVHAYVDGAFAATLPASSNRPDVALAYPGWGPAHGFDVVLPAAAGSHTVCVYGIDVGPVAPNSLIGCRTVVRNGLPFGALDAVVPTYGAVQVVGWAIDPDTTGPIDVHVYVDGAGVPLRAGDTRPDLGVQFPGFGSAHGFNGLVAASPGSHRVCAYGIDSDGVANTTLGCTTVTVPQPSPFGAVDVARRVGDAVEVAGWVIDPDTASSIDVHVYVDGRLISVALADTERLDVAAVQPSSGATHGFGLAVPVTAGARTVCVYGINVGDGTNALIGCRSIA